MKNITLHIAKCVLFIDIDDQQKYLTFCEKLIILMPSSDSAFVVSVDARSASVKPNWLLMIARVLGPAFVRKKIYFVDFYLLKFNPCGISTV
jgi:hypothetical protein